MTPEMILAAQIRAEVAADALRLRADPPRRIIAPDGGACPVLLRWCKRHGVSLDWIITGDVGPLIRAHTRQRLG